jgi:RNA polymerase sigma-70 factor, ECF subfamily
MPDPATTADRSAPRVAGARRPAAAREAPRGVTRWRERPAADAQLLEVAAADPSALAALYDRYAKLVFGLALAILCCREEAEDLTHEVFVSVCEHPSYDPARGSAGAFLTRLTRSRAIDRLRRRTRSDRLLRTWHDATPPESVPRTPLEQMSMRRAAARVRELLAQLPDAQRQVLEMAYYGGLSQSEIAAGLATPLGTVKSLSRRALVTLGDALSASRVGSAIAVPEREGPGAR